MDWLHSCYALIDCKTRIVRFQFPNEPILEWNVNNLATVGQFISYLKTRKIMSNGYLYHLFQFKDSISETPTLQLVPIIN